MRFALPRPAVVNSSAFNRLRPQGGGGVPQCLSYTSLLNVAYINLNCLTNKVSYVDNLLKSNDINILGVGETWLVSSVTDSFVEIPDYKLIRRDMILRTLGNTALQYT